MIDVYSWYYVHTQLGSSIRAQVGRPVHMNLRPGEVGLDTVSRVLLGAMQLSVASRTRSAPIRVPALATLLTAALDTIIGEPLVARAAAALDGEADARDLDEVEAAITAAVLGITGAQTQLERAAGSLETLLVLASLAQDAGLEGVHMQLTTPDLFDYLAAVVLSRPGISPLTVLVGGALDPGERLKIPLAGGDLLDRLQMAYVADEGHPRWLTELWVRRPPDPVRRRIDDWSGPEHESPATLEVFRRQVPGDNPLGLITTELIALPHRLTSASVTLSLDMPAGEVRAVRTTVRDKYQAPLLVCERVLRLA